MRKVVMVYAAAFAAVCFVAGCSSWREATICISEEQLQDRLDSKFPITKTYTALGTVTYSEPRIALRRENNRVELALDISFSAIVINENNLRATVVMLGSVTYDQDKQALFLTEPHLQQLTLNGEQQQDAQALAALYMPALKKLLKRKPIYRFKEQDGLENLAGRLIKDIVVRDGCLEVVCGV